MTRLLVFGSRSWSTTPKGKRPTADESYKADFERILLWNVLDTDGPAPTVIIEGEAIGADQCARRWAKARGVPVMPFPVDNATDGPWPAAGHRRNARMHRDGRPDRAIGFISGKVGSPLSRGSAGMLAICRRAGTPVIVYREDGVEA